MAKSRWIAFDAHFLDGPLGVDIREKFGATGIALFLGFLSACKKNHVQGQIRYGSDAEALSLLGLPGLELVNESGKTYTLNAFWTCLARHKQIRRTRRARLVQVTSSKWGDWQQDYNRQRERERKGRSAPRVTPEGSRKEPGNIANENRNDKDSDKDKDIKPSPDKPERAKKRATPIPENWKPDADLVAWVNESYPGLTWKVETAKFVNHAQANGRVQKDWRAAWRNWIINSATRYAKVVPLDQRPAPYKPLSPIPLCEHGNSVKARCDECEEAKHG